jgi:hypothetical protein
MTTSASVSRATEALRQQFRDRMTAELARTVRSHPPVRLHDGSIVQVVDLACAAGVTALEPLLAQLADVQARLDAVRGAAGRLYTLNTQPDGADELSIVDALDDLRHSLLSPDRTSGR